MNLDTLNRLDKLCSDCVKCPCGIVDKIISDLDYDPPEIYEDSEYKLTCEHFKGEL